MCEGKLVTDTAGLLECWKSHFHTLGKSTQTHNQAVADACYNLGRLDAASRNQEDLILDTDIMVEELEFALKLLKRGRSPGHDYLLSEHICHAGEVCKIVIKQIFNAILNLEVIPPSFKFGVITPIYKGKGKDPLVCNSYRGITVSSNLAKLLEIILLQRMRPLLEEKGLPFPQQTAYKQGVGCDDAIFTTMEVMKYYKRNGDQLYLCAYDFEKAFDCGIFYSTPSCLPCWHKR